MRVIPRIEPKNLSGLVDKVVGLGKEITGEAIDEPRLIEAGTAQQSKGTEKLNAIRKQAKAEKHRERAQTEERKQRSAQSEKEDKAS